MLQDLFGARNLSRPEQRVYGSIEPGLAEDTPERSDAEPFGFIGHARGIIGQVMCDTPHSVMREPVKVSPMCINAAYKTYPGINF